MIRIQNNKISKILLFTVIVAFFSLLSFFLRNILVEKFNGIDLFLIKIDFIKNYGAAFSLFHTHTSFLITVSISILFILLMYIYETIERFKTPDLLFYSLLTSGIICNLTERLTDGYVTDYIRLNFIVFPIFNISDLFICIGAFALVCNILFNNEQRE